MKKVLWVILALVVLALLIALIWWLLASIIPAIISWLFKNILIPIIGIAIIVIVFCLAIDS